MSQTTAVAPGARRRKRKAMSPVPPATSSRRWSGCGASQSIIASFHRRWTPPDIRSFIRSYLPATEEKTPWTSPAFSSSGTSRAPKWVVLSLMPVAALLPTLRFAPFL